MIKKLIVEISIKVNIADRIYPLTIKTEEEESIRKAAKLINEQIRENQLNYEVKDKQDLLSMCALQFATEVLGFRNKNVKDQDVILSKINAIDRLVTESLT